MTDVRALRERIALAYIAMKLGAIDRGEAWLEIHTLTTAIKAAQEIERCATVH